jgi:hypothetical protein
MDLTGARLKVDRAQMHLDALQSAALKWQGQAPEPSFVVDVEDEGRVHIVRVSGVPEVPVAWAGVLGDMLHNLRSSLDHLAWQLVIAGGGEPNRHTYFPILKKRADRSVTSALKGAPVEAVERIRELQPYVRCASQAEFRNDALHMIQSLNIADKHRLLVLCATVTDTLSHEIRPDVVGATVTLTMSPAQEGSEVMRVTNLPVAADDIGLNPSGTFAPWLAETDETAYVAIDSLGLLVKQVTAILDGMEQVAAKYGFG